MTSSVANQVWAAVLVTILLVAALIAVATKWACAASKCKIPFTAAVLSDEIVQNTAWTPTSTPESTPPGTLKGNEAGGTGLARDAILAEYSEPAATLTRAEYAEVDEGGGPAHAEYAEPDDSQYEQYIGEPALRAHAAPNDTATLPQPIPTGSNVSTYATTATPSTTTSPQQPKIDIVQIYGDVRDTDDDEEDSDAGGGEGTCY